MKKTNRFLYILLFIFNNSISAQGIYMNDPMWLSKEQIEEFTQNTLNGNCDYCCKLAEYYGLYLQDTESERYWRQVGAENGNLYCQYNYAISLKYVTINRYRFFINKAAELGFQLAIDTMDDNNIVFVNFSDDEFSDEISGSNLKKFIKGAELGNGLAALKVSNYLKKIQINEDIENITSLTDKTHYIYWLRIGAQNGNQECIKQYYELLKASKNEYDNIRAQFWERKIEK